MVTNIKETAELVQEIAAASIEQTSGVAKINSAVGRLSQTTQQNASSWEELAATAEEMSNLAQQLQETMAFFKLASTADAGSTVKQARLHKAILVLTRAGQGTQKSVGNVALVPAGVADESAFTRF